MSLCDKCGARIEMIAGRAAFDGYDRVAIPCRHTQGVALPPPRVVAMLPDTKMEDVFGPKTWARFCDRLTGEHPGLFGDPDAPDDDPIDDIFQPSHVLDDIAYGLERCAESLASIDPPAPNVGLRGAVAALAARQLFTRATPRTA